MKTKIDIETKADDDTRKETSPPKGQPRDDACTTGSDTDDDDDQKVHNTRATAHRSVAPNRRRLRKREVREKVDHVQEQQTLNSRSSLTRKACMIRSIAES